MQLEQVYGEVFRVLKPGSYFLTYEWVSTNKYDPKNAQHVKIMDEINFGNGLPVRALPCGAPKQQGKQQRGTCGVLSLGTEWVGLPTRCLGAGDADVEGGGERRQGGGL